LDSCSKLRKAQVDKIEATYTYLQEQPSGNNTQLFSDIPPDGSCLNQDLIKLTEKIKLRKEGKVDYEMVLLKHSICTQSTFQVCFFSLLGNFGLATVIGS